jgi:signal transduction histidine kinase
VVALTAYDPVLREKTLRASQTVVERSVLIKSIVESVKSVIVDNVLDDPRWVHIAGTEHVRSWMGIPMVVQGELIGILMFSNDQVAAYSEDHLSLGSAFAAQAGLAMRNAQQFEAEQHDRLMAQLLQQTSEALSSSLMLPETLDQIVSLLHRVIPYDAAIIWEVTEEGQGVIPVVSSGISVQEDKLHETRYDLAAFPQFAEVLIQSKPLILNNTDGYSKWLGDPPGAWAGVPLIVRGKPIGFVSIANHASNSLRDVDIDVLMAFANQAAVAIDNAQLLEAQQAYITELQEAHNTLQRTSRVSAAGEIAMGIAHQINNPLTAIIAESHLLLNKVAEDSPYYEQLQAIRQAAYRAGTVVQRMLDFSRVRPYDLKPLNVNDSIRNAVALIRAQIEPHIASLSLDLESNLPLVRGSSQHLEDVWLNILLNARDAVLERPDSRINVVTQLVNSAMLEIIFRDNGVGISPENLEHLFDPFFTTKDYGTGLGLSVCYDIVTHHGGTIRAESTPGGGSAFFIRLPIETPLKEGE